MQFIFNSSEQALRLLRGRIQNFALWFIRSMTLIIMGVYMLGMAQFLVNVCMCKFCVMLLTFDAGWKPWNLGSNLIVCMFIKEASTLMNYPYSVFQISTKLWPCDHLQIMLVKSLRISDRFKPFAFNASIIQCRGHLTRCL